MSTEWVMMHQLYPSMDELLAPETLTALTGQSVKYVRCLPMQAGYSGSSLLHIEANGEQGVRRFVLKRMSRQWDWVMAVTDDQRCRAVTLWQAGLFDRLKPVIEHATLACARDGDGWALLMDDVSPMLVVDQPFTVEQVYFLLDALATLHATFWEAAELAAPELGLCATMELIQVFSPVTAHRLPSTSSPIPQWLVEGWSVLQGIVASDVADVLNKLYMDPQPLCNALARYPTTLVHGDYRWANLGIVWQAAPQALILDWQLGGYSAATIDLAWLLYGVNMLLSPVPTDVATEYYRQRLAERLGTRFDESWWQPLWALGQLANVLRSGCPKAWSLVNPGDPVHQAVERKALASYEEQVRTALPWL
jgi:hypothetical protein